jgi:hypothetical protein
MAAEVHCPVSKMDALRQDLLYAFRLLGKNPAFALATVLVFALGIGLNVAVFTLVDAVCARSRTLSPTAWWCCCTMESFPFHRRIIWTISDSPQLST